MSVCLASVSRCRSFSPANHDENKRGFGFMARETTSQKDEEQSASMPVFVWSFDLLELFFLARHDERDEIKTTGGCVHGKGKTRGEER